MSPRRIYIDIDDVIAETIARLLDLLEEMHDRRVDLHAVEHFDLTKSLGLNAAELASFMDRAHDDDFIESIRPKSGAADVLASWADAGHRITLVTGRPPITNAASRRWLESHRFSHDALHHLDKWSRPLWNEDNLPAISFEDIAHMEFDFAVEDSLDTAARLVEDFGIPVALMDRPWNRNLESIRAPTRAALVRCTNWSQVARHFGSDPDRERR